MWTIEELKQQCKKIHFFGVGFIQLKLNDHLRLHFYTTKYCPTVEDDEIHDHRYDFTSKILTGRLVNNIYKVELQETTPWYKPSKALYTVSCDPIKPVKEKPKTCYLYYPDQKVYEKGDTYSMSWKDFHRVHTKEDTITLLLRSGYRQEFAHAVKDSFSPVVCPFSLQVPEKELWTIVEEMWKKI